MPALDRKKVLDALTDWLRSPSTHPVVRILEGKKPERSQQLYFKEAPRLVIVLEGIGRYIIVEHGHEMMFDLSPGQVLYLAPCTWSCPLPQVPYKSLAITMRPDFTRVTIHSRQAVRKNGVVPWRYLAEWQTSASLGSRGEHLLKLLDDSAPSRLGRSMYNMIVEMLISEVTGLVEDASELLRSKDTVLWHSLCDYISAHWSDPNLSREQMAAFFQRHPNHISRFFHQHARQNFRSYLNEIRLKRSTQFLNDMRYNVSDAAGMCGFADLQYFIRCFRKRFGFTPGEYRKQRVE